MSIRVSGPMISCTSPPEQKLSPAPVDHDRADVARVLQPRGTDRAAPRRTRTSADSSCSGRFSVSVATRPSTDHRKCCAGSRQVRDPWAFIVLRFRPSGTRDDVSLQRARAARPASALRRARQTGEHLDDPALVLRRHAREQRAPVARQLDRNARRSRRVVSRATRPSFSRLSVRPVTLPPVTIRRPTARSSCSPCGERSSCAIRSKRGNVVPNCACSRRRTRLSTRLVQASRRSHSRSAVMIVGGRAGLGVDARRVLPRSQSPRRRPPRCSGP